MQKSYNFVMANSFPYFENSDLEKKETIYYERLARTYQFLFLKLEVKFDRQMAKKKIEKWWNNLEPERIKKIKECLFIDYNLPEVQSVIKQYFPELQIISPSKTLENESIRTCIIGIKSISINDLEKEQFNIFLLGILFELSKLDIDITEFILVFIDNNNFVNQVGFNSWKQALDEINKLLEQNIQPVEQIKFILQPKFITEKDLSVLPGNYILIEQDENSEQSSILKTLFLLRDLSIIRESLDKNSKIENEWLNKLETTYKIQINENLKRVNINSYSSELSEIIQKTINNEINISEEEFKRLFYQSQKITNQIQEKNNGII